MFNIQICLNFGIYKLSEGRKIVMNITFKVLINKLFESNSFYNLSNLSNLSHRHRQVMILWLAQSHKARQQQSWNMVLVRILSPLNIKLTTGALLGTNRYSNQLRISSCFANLLHLICIESKSKVLILFHKWLESLIICFSQNQW